MRETANGATPRFAIVASFLLAAAGCGRLKPREQPDATPEPYAETTADGGAEALDWPSDGADDRLLPSVTLSPMFAEWPLVASDVESRAVTSFDRAGGNDDGFAGTYSELYAADGAHVIVDVLGPGRLDTLWFTSAISGTSPLGIGRVSISVDDATLTTADADQLFKGGIQGFPSSHVFDNTRSTGGFVSWVPIVFAKRLVITTERRPSFYSAHYEALDPSVSWVSWKPSAPLGSWAGGLVAPGPDGDGKEVPLDVTLDGPAMITALTFRPDAAATPVSPAVARAARLRIWWDDEVGRGVDCPLDTFFGSGLGEAKVDAVAFSMAPGRWQNRMPMPFWRRARIQVTGLPGRLFLRVAANPYDASRASHLRVFWHEERPNAGAGDFEMLNYIGAGRLVATVLTIEPPDAARDKQWWEGDLRSYADGRRTPGVHGTGHEDDHFGGWSNEFFSTPFSLPMHGEPRVDLHDRNGQYNGDVTMYRIWPGVPFLSWIRHSVEHGTENGRLVNESAAAFFYGEPRQWLVEDASSWLSVCNDAARAAHAMTVAGETRLGTLTSAFEGRDYRAPVPLCHHAHTGKASFEMKVVPNNRGVYLRRTYDQSTGPQSAVVRVNGRVAGTWRTVERNATLRWAERDFFIPPGFSGGDSPLSIEIEPSSIPGAPAWDAAEYRTLSVVPPAMP